MAAMVVAGEVSLLWTGGFADGNTWGHLCCARIALCTALVPPAACLLLFEHSAQHSFALAGGILSSSSSSKCDKAVWVSVTPGHALCSWCHVSRHARTWNALVFLHSAQCTLALSSAVSKSSLWSAPL